MLYFADINHANLVMSSFYLDEISGYPEEFKTNYRNFMTRVSPVDRIVDVAEYLYASRSILGTSGLELGAGLLAYSTFNGWRGLHENDRGSKMIKALRRELGEEPPVGFWPDPVEDPEINSEMKGLFPNESEIDEESQVPTEQT